MKKKTEKEVSLKFSVAVTPETLRLLKKAENSGLFVNEYDGEEEEYEMGDVVSVAYKMIGDFDEFLPILELFNKHYIMDDKPHFILKEAE
jgi:hypothetical protein